MLQLSHYQETCLEVLKISKSFLKWLNPYHRCHRHQGRDRKTIDAFHVTAPKPHNTCKENIKINTGRMPDGEAENPDRLQKKELDSYWIPKNSINLNGYKNSSRCCSGPVDRVSGAAKRIMLRT
jgi:hypothetical protein